MKSSELKDRSDSELSELSERFERELFGFRMQNHTGQLDDTSQIKKTRRILARIAQVRGQRAAGQAAAAARGSDK